VEIQQVSQFLVVELDVRTHDEVVLGGVRLGCREDGLETSWDQSLLLLAPHVAHHGVGLARSCLSVGEDCSIVTLQNFPSEAQAGDFEDVGLKSLWGEDIVEGEYSIIISLTIHISQGQLFFGCI
jgi:hypothetical protein